MRMRAPLDGFVTRTNEGGKGEREATIEHRLQTAPSFSSSPFIPVISSLSLSLLKVQHRVYCPRPERAPPVHPEEDRLPVRPPVSTRCRGYPLRCCPPILHSSWQIISRSKRDANGERTENPFCIASRRRRIQCTAFSSPSQRRTDATDAMDGL